METALMPVPNLSPALAEIVLAAGAMLLLLFGVYMKGNMTRLVSIGAVVLCVIAGGIILGQPDSRVLTFGGAFVMDGFGQFMKILVLLGSVGAILLSYNFIRREHMDRFEYPVLIVLATLGMLMMVSANDLISLYVGLELQSLSLYIIAAFNRDSVRSTEAGLKYFVLGALASGMMLYGASLIYGFTGTTNFDLIAGLIKTEGMSLGLIFGLVFVLVALAFKISAVPFHMWTPDVYEGAPTPVTAFFASAPKVAAMALLLRVTMGAFPDAGGEWRQIVVFIAIASMLLGSFAAIGQTNIKRLMAYSSIGHMGFALVGLSAGTEEGVRGVVLYMTIYMIMTLGVFCCILAMRRKEEGMVEDIEDLAGLSQHQPLLAFLFSMLMFSLAGVPPLAGFFAKYFVFAAAIEAELYTLAVIGVLSSVVAAFYYLRVVKVIYFDEPAAPFEQPLANELRIVLGASSIVTLFFVAYPAPLIALAQAAAGSLMP
ncbi:NADH-quinone oxidoreductase subunit NuoN [Tepidicaulis sp. LMO-SS28]|uniref:NADH-quinone oxidoreductase subunit NuoN n=1 Tax=Tepidicaulis sp. LMO-SS28 TaxID=3447455 RepID=UPI003EE38743